MVNRVGSPEAYHESSGEHPDAVVPLLALMHDDLPEPTNGEEDVSADREGAASKRERDVDPVVAGRVLLYRGTSRNVDEWDRDGSHARMVELAQRLLDRVGCREDGVVVDRHDDRCGGQADAEVSLDDKAAALGRAVHNHGW